MRYTLKYINHEFTNKQLNYYHVYIVIQLHHTRLHNQSQVTTSPPSLIC